MTDYIGAKLSLISKSDIRYVGILHEIDSANSTVSLEQVRSFGTEGRKGDPSLEIPASDNVFEYIIFRGSDVKDLRVEEGAAKQQAPPAPQQAPQDPAILQTGPVPAHHQAPPQGYQNHGQGYGMPQQAGYGYGYPPPQQQQHFGGPPSGYGYPPQHHAPYQTQQNQGPFAPPPQNAFPDLPSETKQERSSTPAQTQLNRKDAPTKTEVSKSTHAKVVPALPLPAHAPSPKPKSAKEIESLAKDVSKLSTSSADGPAPKRNALLEVQRNMKGPTPATTATATASQETTQKKPEKKIFDTSAAGSTPAKTNTNARRETGVRQNGVIVNPSAAIVIPRDEYDFSSANAKFDKESAAAEVSAAPVYNKKSSFFDSISSEATDRSSGGGGRGRGRELRDQERSMNYETFGEDLAFRGNRGRGRGGRGRGRGRGRGPSQAVDQK